MKNRLILAICVMCVSILVLMQNTLASIGPPVWINQATISIIDPQPSEDPEIAGYGSIQAVVWEEQNPSGDWDIHMRYSLTDGAIGSWIMPPLQPAATFEDEINPAVAVTFVTGDTMATEIHVAYQKFVPKSDGSYGFWQVYHTYTTNFGLSWVPPVLVSSAAPPELNAIDPACVFTEDLAPRVPGQKPFAVQIVWAEETGLNTADYLIKYQAYRYDPSLAPSRAYHLFAGGVSIRGNPFGAGFSCMKPEIASIDDNFWTPQNDFYFAVVWEEEMPTALGPNQWNIYYLDGQLITSGAAGPPPRPAPGFYPGTPGIINLGGIQVDALEPDIAATQDYAWIYYIHIVYQYKTWIGFPSPPASPNSIESSYYSGGLPMPGSLLYIPLTVKGGTTTQLENPTVASKLISQSPVTFESWICWEDWALPTASDIFYRMGTYNTGTTTFTWWVPPGIVGYSTTNQAGPEHNPELWNRNDGSRLFPAFTHLVFDDLIPTGVPEILYIDP